MDRRSQLMALAVAFVVAAALLPATARAADTCLADPTGAARNGKHWYYQTNLETQQKCWFLGAHKTAARKAVPRSSFDSADQHSAAEQIASTTCVAAPSGHTPRGRRWSYQTDPTTGQKCWRLSGRVYRAAKAVPEQPPAPAQQPIAGEPSIGLPRSLADAQASVQENAPANVQEAIIPALLPHETVSSASEGSEPATHEAPPVSTFESRWINDFKMASVGDSRPGRSDNPGIDQPAAADVGQATFKNAELILAAGPPLIDIIVVFVATLGSLLILLGFLDWSFLFRGSAFPDHEHRSPLKLPKLESDSDPIPNANVEGRPVSGARRGRDDMLSLFAPIATATDFGTASRFLLETV
jgi:hypothetical protein